MGIKYKILILEDDSSDLELEKQELKNAGMDFETRAVETRKDFIEALLNFKPDLIISDYKLPAFDGLEAFNIAKKKCPEIPFIVISGTVADKKGLEVKERGAFEYLPKDQLVKLSVIVLDAIEILKYTRPRILFLEDNIADYELEKEILRNKNIIFLDARAQGKSDFVRLLEEFGPDIIVTDFTLPDIDSFFALKIVKEKNAAIPVVMVSGTIGEEKALELFDLGLSDFALKQNLPRFGFIIKRLLNEFKVKKEHQKTEIKARENFLISQIFVNALQAPAFLIDLKGTILFCNMAFAKMNNLSAEDCLGLNYFEMPDLTGYKEQIREVTESLIDRTEAHFEFNFRDQVFEVYIYPAKNSLGLVDKFIIISFDITETKKVKEQLIQSQKLEAIGTLSGGIAHDFNNLLTAIIGNTQLAVFGREKDEDLCSTLNEVLNASNRAAALTKQLLLFGRKQQMFLTGINMNSTIKNLLKMLQRLMGEDLLIKIDLQQNIWNIFADERRLEQVLMNLSVNARDAMPKGGTLIIQTENIVIDKETQETIADSYPGKFIKITIEDTGKGIEQDIMTHIFEPFFTTKEFGKGTGLGLSVVYGIIKEHKGWINVYSEINKGTTFRVYLPAYFEEIKKEVQETAGITDLKGHKERILLIEDEETILRYAKRILTKNGYIVFEAKDGNEALTLFNKENKAFDLIFTDSILPGTTGLELAEKLLSMKPDIKILLTSGYLDDKSQWQTIKEKEYAFLQKPYGLQELLRTMREVLEKNK